MDSPIVIPAIATALATVVGILIKTHISRLRLLQSEYADLVETNKSFRDEIRAELTACKHELEKVKADNEGHKIQIENLKKRNFELECEIRNRDYHIVELQKKLEAFQIKSLG